MINEQRMKERYIEIADVDTEMTVLQTRLQALADENLVIQARMNALRDARINATDLAFVAIGEETGLRAKKAIVNPSEIEAVKE